MLVNKILFPISSTIKAKYSGDSNNASLFDGDNLVIKPIPSKYTAIWESDPVTLIDGYASVIGKITSRRYSFEVETEDGRYPTYLILRELLDIATAIPSTITPITCLDYIFPEFETEYIERSGIIQDLRPLSGTVNVTGNSRGLMGISFKFTEIEPRFNG